MQNHSHSEKTKENIHLNPKSGTNSNRRLMTPSIKNINLNMNSAISKEKKLISSTAKFSTNLSQKENLNKSQNFATNISINPSKRKFTEIQKEKEAAKSQISHLLNQIDALYESKLEDEQFLKEFKEILDRENTINYARLNPISLNTKGSCLLENSKFYLLFIRFKSLTHTDSSGLATQLTLDDYIILMDNCLTYDQSDLNLLYSKFIETLSKYYSKAEIFIRLQKKEANYMVQNGISDLEDLKESHFKYLLAKPESFMKFELYSGLKSKESNQSVQNSSKKKKIDTTLRERLEKSPVFKKLLYTASKKAQKENSGDEVDGQQSKASVLDLKEIPFVKDGVIPEVSSELILEENNLGAVKSLEEVEAINEDDKEASPSRKVNSQGNESNHSQPLLSENKSQNYRSSRHSLDFDKKLVNEQGSNMSSSKHHLVQANRIEENSLKKYTSMSKKKEATELSYVKMVNNTNIEISLNNIEHFADSTSKLHLDSISSPIVNIFDTKKEINGITDSNPVSNTNFSVQMNNLPNSFNCLELNVTSFSSSFLSIASKGNLSSDAQILYQEIILRNKIDLEIEKKSIQLKGIVKKPPKKKIYKVECSEKFSLVPQEKVIKEEVHENLSENKGRRNNMSKKIKRNNSKSLMKIKREEEEEKTAEDIDIVNTDDEEGESKKGNKKKTKNLKNKKKFQSDAKPEKVSYISSEEKESNPKKKKNKKEESKEEVKRGRRYSSVLEIPKEKSKKEKNKRSPPISDKESENEDKKSYSKNQTKKKEKEGRSKSTTRGKKK